MVALILAAAPAAASPAPPPAGSPRFAEEVVVTAERGATARAETPAAVSVLTGEDARRLPAESLSGLLDHMPGFQVLFGEGFGLSPMVMARGFFAGGEAEYVQLLVDGVPAADVESGLADWRRIRAADVERVEALRGPGSPLYGDTALGGVVQVFTRHAAAQRARALSVSGASFGTLAGDGLWRSAAGGGLGLEASGAHTDGFRAHSASDDGGVSLALGGGAGRRVAVTLDGSARRREEPGPLDRDQVRADRFGSAPLFRFDREDTRRGRLSVSIRRADGAAPYRALLFASVRDTSFLRTLLIAAGLGDRSLREVDTRSAGLVLEAARAGRLAGREARLRAGVEASRDHAATRYRAVDEDGVAGDQVAMVDAGRDRLGAFVTGDWRARRRLRLAAGARFDAIADDAGPALGGRITRSAWSPHAGATVLMGPPEAPVSVFVQASRAFKAATLDQLADPRPFPDFQGGTFTISNPRLQPQRAASLEAGVAKDASGGRLEAVAYRTAVEDEIDFDPATFRYANIGRSLHRGIEASATAFSRRAVSPRVSYAWTRVGLRGAAAPDGQLKNIPEHLLRAGMAARLPGGMEVDARLTRAWRRFADDENRVPLQDATVIDLRASRTFGRVRARLDATNLTDGRGEAVGYTLPDFEGRPVAYAFPGSGRAIRAGLDLAF